jgi:hypothetical protein
MSESAKKSHNYGSDTNTIELVVLDRCSVLTFAKIKNTFLESKNCVWEPDGTSRMFMVKEIGNAIRRVSRVFFTHFLLHTCKFLHIFSTYV